MKLCCIVEGEVRDYVAKNDKPRYSHLEIDEDGLLHYRDEGCPMIPFSPFIHVDEIIDLLRWYRAEAVVRSKL